MSEHIFSTSVPAKARHLKAIRGFYRSVLEDIVDVDLDMLVLALDEACSNLLKHAPRSGPEQIHVRAEVLPDLIRFAICDFCGPDDISTIKPRELGIVRPGGLGTHFIGEIMDRVAYEPDPDRPDRMVLVLEKGVPTREKPRE